MSELEDRWFWAYPTESVDCDGITGSAHEVYSKSDVDEVIAEKDKQLRHHKYKRCLNMAARCESEEKRLDAIAPLFDNDKECWEYSSDFLSKWARRWLKIAEQFKEEK